MSTADAVARCITTTTTTTHAKRRNGKLQSCEPCRKRKLSCDHRVPACSRCIRRKHAHACYYHPAPMTKSAQSIVLPPEPLSRAESLEVPPLERMPEILSVPSAGILMDTSAATGRSVGYLGEISSSAFVTELNDNFGIDTPATLDEPHVEHLSDDDLQQGVRVLTFFQNIAKVGEFVEKWLKIDDSFLMYNPVYRIWFDGLMLVFQNVTHTRSVMALAARVWCNTQQPLPCTRETNFKEWAHAGTGHELRWETLGLILTEIGVIASSLPGWDPIFEDGYERKRVIQTALQLATMCVDLSKRCGSRNDLLVCLLYERMLLISIIRGDTSSAVWTSFSEVCDTAVLLGLHLEIPAGADVPFFLRELRSRIFNVVYSMDKFLSTFLGRPPRISFRYAVVREPHDLTDLEVCADPVGLQKRLLELAATGGWSTTGNVARATWRKAWTKRHILREEVLEIVIGPHITDIAARLDYVRAREQDALASMPEFCRLDPEQLIANIKRDPMFQIPSRGVPWRPVDLQCFLAMHCSTRHATFLLERAALNRTKCHSSRLIAAARSLLTLILKANTVRDFLLQFHMDLTDSLAFYAVPAAGVLAIEMLKRDQLNDPADDFPRSEVLQQLSVLVPALEDVRPEEGNYPICMMGLNAIKKVLDKLLSRLPVRQAAVDAGNGEFTDVLLGVNMCNDADFLQWLGNVDFDAANWHMPP